MSAAGFIAAVLSAVFNGSFASVFKTERVERVQLHPLLFQLYVSIGVFLSSMLTLPFVIFNRDFVDDNDVGTSITFTWLGLVAGTLFVLAITFSFSAIEHIGVALGQGIWGGFAILVSFVWGVVGFGNSIKEPVLAIGAILLLLGGVVGIAFCETIALWVSQHHHVFSSEDDSLRASLPDLDSKPLKSPLLEAEADTAVHRTQSKPSLQEVVPEDEDTELGGASHDGEADANHRITARDADGAMPAAAKETSFLFGVSYAALVGIFGGSILVPMHYVPDSASGLAFVPSFGVGALVASPAVVAAVLLLRREPLPPLHLAATLPAGIFSGLVWNISNICSIVAIPSLGYAVAYPMLQCALFIGALWGVFAFGEIKGLAVYILFAAGIVLLVGAVCLALAVSS